MNRPKDLLMGPTGRHALLTYLCSNRDRIRQTLGIQKPTPNPERQGEPMNPLQTQQGGKHYKKLAIQPMEFSMVNRLDACAHTALKYITRHPDKGGREDLEKGFHCIELREALGTSAHIVHEWVVDIMDYCRANNLAVEESAVLCDLCSWLENGDPLRLRRLKQNLRALITLRYGE